MRFRSRRGFTLIELLVVIAIIAILIALLIPAVQRVLAASLNMSCKNNLRQIGIASHHYESNYDCFPSLGPYAPETDPEGPHATSWSVHSILLPYIEQGNLFNLINFGLTYDEQPNVIQQRIPTFLCPAEQNDRAKAETAPDGTPRSVYPTSYGFCYGTWLVFDPVSMQGGDGAIVVNGVVKYSGVSDGLSNTLYVADVKAWTPYYDDIPNPPNASPPSSVADVIGYCTGGTEHINPSNYGHTEWEDARVFLTGFTTAFPPNTPVLYHASDDNTYDIDFISSRESDSATLPTYAAVTARSYHSGSVNAMMMDGSVQSISNSVSMVVWRALGTRAGGEVVGQGAF